MDLPIYRFVVSEDDETGVDAIALVDDPAIELNWQAFKNQFVIEPNPGESKDEFVSRCISIEVGNGYEQEQAAAICYAKWEGKQEMRVAFSADTEKRIISGPLMVADLPIYRKDRDGKEYYGVFTSEDIYNVVKKFFRNNRISEVNMMHNPAMMVDNVYMIESFIIDSKRGVNAPTGYALTDGSWFGSFKIDNEDVWNEFIKSGKFKGFSVEGLFNTERVDVLSQKEIDEIIEVVKEVDESKLEDVKMLLKKATY